MDKIFLNEMEFYGYHGVLTGEKQIGQRFRATVVMSVDLKQAGQTDDLQETINYAEVYQLCKKIVEGSGYNLIEALAEHIASEILTQYSKVQEVNVTVTKPDPPIPGHYQSVAVEITRSRTND
ncbi:dihydroneopterin aldolase [Bacillus chungangensis]|uniref:7,8-dihydroneopterin aldolase n=1 Tax=Bacillus chungangensis TaxID=587633 RepID=A0ABT9WX55_9BACI|nr:dihydroneopterin aldolase [Bacillus chungangensis]MDQ0177881.1 dihydroneopterin aldolase [Bacillus chungangensis]